MNTHRFGSRFAGSRHTCLGISVAKEPGTAVAVRLMLLLLHRRHLSSPCRVSVNSPFKNHSQVSTKSVQLSKLLPLPAATLRASSTRLSRNGDIAETAGRSTPLVSAAQWLPLLLVPSAGLAGPPVLTAFLVVLSPLWRTPLFMLAGCWCGGCGGADSFLARALFEPAAVAAAA